MCFPPYWPTEFSSLKRLDIKHKITFHSVALNDFKSTLKVLKEVSKKQNSQINIIKNDPTLQTNNMLQTTEVLNNLNKNERKLNNIINVVPDNKELGFVGVPKEINSEFLKNIINEKNRG